MEWLPLINTLGWPGLGLVLVARYVVPWLATRIELVVARHLKFVDAVDQRGVDAAKDLAGLVEMIKALVASNVALTVRQSELTRAQTATSQEVTKKLANGGNGH